MATLCSSAILAIRSEQTSNSWKTLGMQGAGRVGVDLLLEIWLTRGHQTLSSRWAEVLLR